MKRTAKGFTLVELMITLAILAIIMTIGYPLYQTQLEKARRTDARSGLTKLAMAQERYYGMFGSYADKKDKLNFGPDGKEDGANDIYSYKEAVSDLDYDGNGEPDYYTIEIGDDGDPTTFTITATATGSQTADEDCRLFTINQLGVKEAEDSGGNDRTERCW